MVVVSCCCISDGLMIDEMRLVVGGLSGLMMKKGEGGRVRVREGKGREG